MEVKKNYGGERNFFVRAYKKLKSNFFMVSEQVGLHVKLNGHTCFTLSNLCYLRVWLEISSHVVTRKGTCEDVDVKKSHISEGETLQKFIRSLAIFYTTNWFYEEIPTPSITCGVSTLSLTNVNVKALSRVILYYQYKSNYINQTNALLDCESKEYAEFNNSLIR